MKKISLSREQLRNYGKRVEMLVVDRVNELMLGEEHQGPFTDDIFDKLIDEERDGKAPKQI